MKRREFYQRNCLTCTWHNDGIFSGPFAHKSFRMIDASANDLRDPTDRNRKDSITSSVIIMNDQYRQQQSKGTRSRHSSITSTSTMRSNRFAPGSYAIETSFCGAKPITQPSAYNLAQQDQELGNQTPQSRANRWVNFFLFFFLTAFQIYLLQKRRREKKIFNLIISKDGWISPLPSFHFILYPPTIQFVCVQGQTYQRQASQDLSFKIALAQDSKFF